MHHCKMFWKASEDKCANHEDFKLVVQFLKHKEKINNGKMTASILFNVHLFTETMRNVRSVSSSE